MSTKLTIRRKNPPFAPVPIRIVEDKAVSDGAFRFWALLWKMADWGTRLVETTAVDLAARIDANERTVRAYLGQLTAAGVLTVKRERYGLTLEVGEAEPDRKQTPDLIEPSPENERQPDRKADATQPFTQTEVIQKDTAAPSGTAAEQHLIDFIDGEIRKLNDGQRPPTFEGKVYGQVRLDLRGLLARGNTTDTLKYGLAWWVGRKRWTLAGFRASRNDIERVAQGKPPLDGQAPRPGKTGGLAGTEDRNRPDDFWGGQP